MECGEAVHSEEEGIELPFGASIIELPQAEVTKTMAVATMRKAALLEDHNTVIFTRRKLSPY